MRLQIQDGDGDGFTEVRDWLVDGFYAWLGSERQLDDELAVPMAEDAELMLDWKFGYDDGHLGRWTIGDVTEFLLRWCPRKLSLDQEDCIQMTSSVAAFTDYLAAQRLLAKGSSPAAALRSAALGATEELMAEARAGSVRPAGAGLLSAPPVVLPPAEAIEESRASAPILAVFAKLAEFVATGRQLTEDGNLGLADSRELVGLLETGDQVDELAGDSGQLIRSSADLPVLNFVFRWAVQAAVLTVRQGKVLVTESGLDLLNDPAGVFDAALDALLEIGPVTGQRQANKPANWEEIDSAVDGMVMMFVLRPYAERRPIPLAELIETTALTLTKLYGRGDWSDEAVAAHVRSMIVAVMNALELAGVVRRVNAIGDDPDRVAQDLGDVELTPAGVPAVRRMLVESGIDVPVAGGFADGSALELLTGVDRGNSILVGGEFEVWRRQRSPEQALADLAEAVRQLDEPGLRDMALGFMSEISPDLAEPYVRELTAERPAVRGFALCWLADNSRLDPKELYDPADLHTFAYVLAHRLVTAKTDGLFACLQLVGDEAAQVRVVSDLGKKVVPMISVVLDAIGRDHPAKPVAKAARKALFQLKSRHANELAGRTRSGS